MKKFLWVLAFLVVLGALVAGGGMWWMAKMKEANTPVFRLAKVSRGDIIATISATGTLQPEESIDVGAQVAGRIVEFGTDIAGHIIANNSEVKAGALLAKIDDVTYVADVNQAQAQIAQDQATIEKTVADLAVAQAKLNQANRDWDRAKTLPAEVLARETYDNYLAARETAEAQLKSQAAMIDEAKAALKRDQANLDRAQRNVGYCTIVAPADGVIIDRRVNIGQTVVSSLNSPSLFLLAKDLRHMWINVAVNEADIGQIWEGQTVTFGVDSRPDETFTGTVRKKRLFGQNTQNVITYPVEITASNPERKLIPYQTANVKFETGRREGVLIVPNSALYYIPDTEKITLADRPNAEQWLKEADDAKPGHIVIRKRVPTSLSAATLSAASGPATSPAESGPRPVRLLPAVLWIKDGSFVRPLQVSAGLSDGINTNVESDQISEGMEIVTGEDAKSGLWGKPAPKK